MQDKQLIVQSVILALGSGLAQSQARKVVSKGVKPVLVGAAAGLSAVLGHYAAQELAKKDMLGETPSDPLLPSERDLLITEAVSAAVVGALASYVADRSGQSALVCVSGVAIASILGLLLGREVADRMA